MTLDPELKARWTAALRGGKYKQGKDALRSDDTFCCLGVLADIIDPDGWDDDDEFWRDAGGILTNDSGDTLVDGLTVDIQGQLSGMNDDCGDSNFAAIADVIDQIL